MKLKVASYNMHKGVGLDRRRDPDRILTVLREIDADVIALQECDRRFGERETVLPRQAIEDHTPWRIVPVAQRPLSMGWHGNGLLVRRGIEVAESAVVRLPMLEPRGAVRADLLVSGQRVRVVGMHLDISGVRRRQQVRSVLAHVADGDSCPAVLMGDLNDWTRQGRALREFGEGWEMLACGRSFPSRRPVATLDRIVVHGGWRVEAAGVHHSALAAKASDHLPVWATLKL
ncbi:MAG: endonuclease/exonuclease/phosphatase family protein [Novosphingobium sp.]